MAAFASFSFIKKIEEEGIKIISPDEAYRIFESHDSNGRYHDEFLGSFSHYLIRPVISSGPFVAIDNSNGDARTEVFKTLDGARRWLNGENLKNVQRDEAKIVRSRKGRRSHRSVRL